MSEPLVSIIIPTRHSSKNLEECLNSIKVQTHQNIEIVVVDNFSADKTPEIAKRYADKVLSRGPERSAQRNFGARHSQGEYLLFVDSDMKLDPGVVASCVAAIRSEKDIQGIVIPEESFGIGFWASCKKLERSFYVGTSWMEAARFFDKVAFSQIGGYDEKMVSGEDWDLSERIGEKHKIGRIDKFIYHNEGAVSLYRTIRKKFYYAKKFNAYAKKRGNGESIRKQTGIISRYKLFFSDSGKLFSDPVLGLGMLFMKTCEFGFGAFGYLAGKIGK